MLPVSPLLSLVATLLAAVLVPAQAQVVRDDRGSHPMTATTAAAVAVSSATAAVSAGQALLRKGRLRRDREAGGRLGAYNEEMAYAMVDFAGTLTRPES